MSAKGKVTMTSEAVFLQELLKLLATGQANKVADAIKNRLKKCDKGGTVTTQGGGLPPQQPPPDPTQPDP